MKYNKASKHNHAQLNSELENLNNLDRDMLIRKWHKLYGNEPPVRIRENFLMQGIAYRIQEQMFGGMSNGTRRFIEKAAQNIRVGKKLPSPEQNIKYGTRLLREWHGITHEVMVLDKCVQYRGKNYRSLSEVAREITGAHWSGPLFFGLRRNSKHNWQNNVKDKLSEQVALDKIEENFESLEPSSDSI